MSGLTHRRLKQSEKAFSRGLSREVMETLFKNHPDGVFLFDTSGYMINVNPACCDISGFSSAELIGRRFVRFIDRSDILNVRKNFEGVSKGKPVHFDTTLIRKDGNKRLLNITAIPITTEDKFEGFYVVARDITENKQLTQMVREVKNEYEDLFENAPMGLFAQAFVGGEYTVTRMNHKATQMYGYSQEEIVGMSVSEFIAEESQETYKKALLEIQKGHHVTYECLNSHKDGSLFPVRVSINVSQRDDRKAIVAVEDISIRTELEESLRQSHESLERTNKLQDLVLRMLSHDFRSPFNSIMGGAKLLMECDLSDEQRELVDIIYRGAKHELALIDNLLKFTQIEGGKIKYNLEPVSAHVIAHEIRKQHQEQAERKHIQIQFGKIDPIHFKADFSVLQRNIVGNIVSNSIKYSYSGSEIRIDIYAASEKEGVVRIQDFGMGIPEEILPHIFEIHPGKRRIGTHKEKSTGFGLYISSQMVKLMGGSISMTSHVEQGTIVKIVLPLSQAPPKEEPLKPLRETTSTHVSTGEHILH
jgi:PAS domain S-box-containing protein